MNNLRNIRKRMGLSLAELHRITGYPLRSLEEWDSNNRQITSYHRIKRLSSVLKCDMDDLMTLEEKCKFGGKSALICLSQDEDGVHVDVYEKDGDMNIIYSTIITRDNALKLLKHMKTHWDVQSFLAECTHN